MVKERPILFSAPMVKAILAGTKTQTRRLVNFDKVAKESGCTKGKLAFSPTFNSWAVFNGNGEAHLCLVKCPFVKGQRLYVKETACFQLCDKKKEKVICYRADGDEIPDSHVWTPSIYMPKWASRITLEVEQVRVEKLKDISEFDARDEGVVISDDARHAAAIDKDTPARVEYSLLWESINGKGSWAADRDKSVWVVCFKRIK